MSNKENIVDTGTKNVNQAGQTVEGNQLNVVGNATIEHLGDMYKIADAHFSLSEKVSWDLLEKFLFGREENLSKKELPSKGGWEPETVFIHAGSFLMGSKLGDGIPAYEVPQFQMILPAYRIGKYPVTNEQFYRFVQEFEEFGVPPNELGWFDGNRPADEILHHPVRGVTWYEALAYCTWLSQETGRPYTLPSEAQWEKAARGDDGQIFPWGNDWENGNQCNTEFATVTAVDAKEFKGGESPYHCLDMVGNIREWTTSRWGRNRQYNLDTITKYPWNITWQPNENQDELNHNRQIRRVTRGGTALVQEVELRAARRQSELPYKRGLLDTRVGFRIALNLEVKA